MQKSMVDTGVGSSNSGGIVGENVQKTNEGYNGPALAQ